MSVTMRLSRVLSARLARLAARAAHSPSRARRTSVISMASSMVTVRTRAPRLRSTSTRPWAASVCRAVLIVNLVAPKRSHRSVSTSRWPAT